MHHSQNVERQRKLNSETGRQKGLIIYKGAPLPLTDDFSSGVIRPEGRKNDISNILKEINCQPVILHASKLTFKNEGKLRHYLFKINEN